MALLALGLSPAAMLPVGDGRVWASAAGVGEARIFGPSQYVRIAGPPNVYSVPVAVPSWVAAPYRLHIQNGEADGSHRLSSATIEVNGVAVAVPADFSQQVTALDRTVTLTPQTSLRLTLDSVPQGFLILDLFGANGDHVAPRIAFDAPGPGSATNDATPAIRIHYSDAAGSGEPGASGVDPATVRVYLRREGEAERDITSLLTVTPSEASGSIPAGSPLADGGYRLRVAVADVAGNAAEATAAFTVDTVAPSLQITEPTGGLYTRQTATVVAGQVSDATPVSVRVEGVTANVQGTSFRAENVPLGAEGEEVLHAEALDAAGNRAEATVTVHVDRTAPDVRITSPLAGSFVRGPTFEALGSVADASPVVVEVNEMPASLVDGRFRAPLGGADGPFEVVVTAVDAAGNRGSSRAGVTLDSSPPVLTMASPADGLVTNAAAVTVAGSVTDLTPVTVTVEGTPVTVEGRAFSREVPLEAEGPRGLTVAATDAVGNVATRVVDVVVDRTAPFLGVVSPGPDAILGSLPVVVRGTVSDATAVQVAVDGVAANLTQNAWEASLAPRPEGAQTIVVTATDAAGNEASRAVPIVLDLTPPTVVVTQPSPGILTRDATVTVVGLATDVSLRSVTANGLAASLEPTGPAEARFTVGVPLGDGDNAVDIVATDALSRTGEVRITVTRDSQPPVISLQAPPQITRSRGGRVAAVVTDNLAVASVVFRLDGVERARLVTPPYETDLAVPEGKVPGDVLLLTVEAADSAGNVAAASQAVRVAPDGVVVGQVLADGTGHPFPGARVRVLGHEERATTTDGRGRYSLPALDAQALIVIDAVDASRVPVERLLTVAADAGTVAVDARLTALSAPGVVGPAGGTVAAEAVSLAVPAGAVGQDLPITLTPLTAQGLPNLLPLGWSPLAAFDLRGPASFGAPVGATVTGVPASVVHLATYRSSVHAWVLVSRDLTVTDGTASVDLLAAGSYALVVPDEGLSVPAPGEVLPALPMQPLAEDAVSAGEVSPLVLPPSGGRSTARLSIRSATAPPSGTVVRTEVTESFTLTSGATGSEETRTQDVVFYRAPAAADAALAAEIPVVPVRTFDPGELVEARVRVAILAGRESVRGRTGGNQVTTVTSGAASLTVAAGSLPEDTAIAVQSEAISPFDPMAPDLTPFAEVVVDLSGRSLALAAELSVDGAGIGPGETLLVARVLRVDGVPRPTVVGVGELIGGRVVARAAPGLPGLRDEGRYVFYRATTPLGFVRGLAVSGTAPVPALAELTGLPFVAVGGPDGRFVLPARAGVVTVSARVPATSLAGAADVTVAGGGTADLTISLTGATTTATVVPADGSTSVSPTAPIEIRAGAPLNEATATAENVRLYRGPVADNQRVPVRLVLSGSGLTLTVIPLTRLEPATTYTLVASGLADAFGGFVGVAPTSFTTKAEAVPQYDTARIVFSFPDANGIVRVQAPPGTLPPGATILILNAGNGIAVSFTVGNDGSLAGDLPASFDDRLLVTITDPLGSVTAFERSQFVADDGSGRVGIGPGGGTVEGAGGVALRIPEGALEAGVIFQVEPFGPDAFPERPDLPGASFGSGLRITAPEKPKLRKEAKLVFQKPADAPDGAFYYVYRRLTGPEGKVAFEVIDHAFVEGAGEDAKVVTASYPFIGWNDSVDSWELAAAGQSIGFGLGATTNMYLMWTVDALRPGRALSGLVQGRVLRAKAQTGTEVEYEPVPNVAVSAIDENGQMLLFSDHDQTTFARSGPDGTYALWDPNYFGGAVQVAAELEGQKLGVTAFEADPDRATDLKLPREYRNVAVANFLFPAKEPPPPAPDVEIHVMRRQPDGTRAEAGGFVIAGTPLVIGFRSKLGTNLRAASMLIQGHPFTVRADMSGGALRMDYVLQEDFTPTTPDSYAVGATLTPPQGPAVTASHTFLVVAPGGDNSQSLPGPPDIVTGLLVPSPGATDVAVGVFPQVTFTEPVRNPSLAVSLLEDGGGEVPIVISAVALDASGNPMPVADLRLESLALPVTSVTVRPARLLKLGTRYALLLNRDGVEDFDSPPQKLRAEATFLSIGFTTFGPQTLGVTEDLFPIQDIAALGDRVYATHRTDGPDGFVRVIDVSKPAEATEIASSAAAVTGQPMGVDAEDGSPVTGGRVVVAGSGLNWATHGPSNLFVWDSSGDRLKRIGVVSLTQGTEEGTILRVALRGRYAYALTFPKGIQLVDLIAAKRLLDQAPSAASVSADIVTPAVGFGQRAIVSTTPVFASPGVRAHLIDLAVDTFRVGAAQRTLVVVTGSLPLAIVDPSTGQTLFQSGRLDVPLGDPAPGSLQRGSRLALTRSGSRTLALVSGFGEATRPQTPGVLVAGPVLAVIDVTNPLGPQPLGVALLDSTPLDVAVKDPFAVVGTVNGPVVIGLADPKAPNVLGRLNALGSRVSVADPDLILATSRSGSGVGAVRIGRLDCARLFPTSSQGAGPLAVAPALGWEFGAAISPAHGLVLDDVRLLDRTLAKRHTEPANGEAMSLPFVDVRTDRFAGRCHLMPSSASACDEGSVRSRLVGVRVPEVPSGAEAFAIEATYALDKFQADTADTASAGQEACLLVTQRYEFSRETYQACEASGFMPCARFKPIVSYRYLAEPAAPALQSVRTVQRFEFDPPPRPDLVPPDGFVPGHMAALFQDCESSAPGSCIFPTIATTPFGNPLAAERVSRIVKEGRVWPTGNLPADNETAAAAPADNLHVAPWTPRKNTIDGPDIFGPGCHECVHIHWRWFTGQALVGILGAGAVSPLFDNNGGRPIIPAGSNQDVDVAIMAAKDNDDEPDGLIDLAGRHGTIFDPARVEGGLPAKASRLVFWYAGTGRRAADGFFLHGGFYSSMKLAIQKPVTSSVRCGGAVEVPIRNATGRPAKWTSEVLPLGVTSGASGEPIRTEGTSELENFSILVGPLGLLDHPDQLRLYSILITLEEQSPTENSTSAGWRTSRRFTVTSSCPSPK